MGLTPGVSRSDEVAVLFAQLGVPASDLDLATYYSVRYTGVPSQSFFNSSETAQRTGLTWVDIYWTPQDGVVRLIRLDYVEPPSQFDARALLLLLGQPAAMQMYTLNPALFAVVLDFPERSTLLEIDAAIRLSDSPAVCLTHDMIETMAVFFYAEGLPSGLCPDFPELLEPISHFSDLTLDEIVHRIEIGDQCIPLNW